MSTGVVVVNYRTNDDLDRFIESYRETVQFGDLVVIDVDPVTPYGWRKVPGRYVAQTQNLGYAYACNMGAMMLDPVCDIYAFFNADVILKEGTVDKTAQALRENPTWGVAGPLQYNSQEQVTHAGIFGDNQHPQHRGWHRRVSNKFRDVREAVSVSGSAYFVSRDCWNDLLGCEIWQGMFPNIPGAFLPTFLFYEETALSYHARSHGWKVMYYGETECVHQWHGAIKRNHDRHEETSLMQDSRELFRMFCDKHGIPRN